MARVGAAQTSLEYNWASTDPAILALAGVDAESNELVWSAYTKTVAPESIDEVVTDVTELLIGELFADELLK